VIDADGSVFPNIYRKSHIPDGPGYQEKFYFNPGDTGFQVRCHGYPAAFLFVSAQLVTTWLDGCILV
jgi:predicted amidohydrolase